MKKPVREIAQALLNEFSTYSEFRRMENSIHDGYAYKPAYRCLSLMLAPGDFRKEYLDNAMVSFEDSCEILKAVDPFFVEYLADRDNFEHYRCLYEDYHHVWMWVDGEA